MLLCVCVVCREALAVHIFCFFFFEWSGDPRDLHVLTHSFPTRRSSDLLLFAVREHGSISAAAKSLGLSYRHVWGELKRWEQTLGRTLIVWDKRSEEHTSELQSLMRISYAVFCLKKKKQ